MSKRKGQNVAEYVILVALIIAAATAMQVYLRRGVQGRMADAIDHTSNFVDTGVMANLTFNTKQYEPYYAKQQSEVVSNVGYQDQSAAFGAFNRTDMNQSTTRMKGAYEASEWSNFNAR